MDSNHSAPAIVITVISDCASLWHEVLLGIEEEGIPFLLQHHPAGEVVDSAWQAARSSPLLVGIACDRHSLVVHYKNLPASAPLFTLMHHQDSQAHATPVITRHGWSKGSLFGISMLNHRRTAV